MLELFKTDRALADFLLKKIIEMNNLAGQLDAVGRIIMGKCPVAFRAGGYQLLDAPLCKCLGIELCPALFLP